MPHPDAFHARFDIDLATLHNRFLDARTMQHDQRQLERKEKLLRKKVREWAEKEASAKE